MNCNILFFYIFSAWTKADLIHKYEENKEKYSQGSKRSGFLDAVKSIERAVARHKQGKDRYKYLHELTNHLKTALSTATTAAKSKKNQIFTIFFIEKAFCKKCFYINEKLLKNAPVRMTHFASNCLLVGLQHLGADA